MGNAKIDKVWFVNELEQRGKKQSDLARFLKVDRSAVSRLLAGTREMSVEEQDRIAEFLDVPVGEVALHRRGASAGFSENGQAVYVGAEQAKDTSPRVRSAAKREGQHPIFGCMKGTMTIPADLDLTAPMDVEWSDKLYNE
ncbi:helix-turn-helix transcriptional regulator [uncultured Agrobacterium sp.]|uniref:helix-turn-helix domain-containing protein n=1 Tax=uncultured Agrobacterium sp. TaxID=157277 RepID=UPI00258F9AA6|nr:helix-turn-helix transcriptional regulator [uncultured Agrobacterium sp.]